MKRISSILCSCLMMFIISITITMNYSESTVISRNSRSNNSVRIEIRSCKIQNWQACGQSIGHLIYYSHSWSVGSVNEFKMLGHKCLYKIHPAISFFGIYRWNAIFGCPTVKNSVIGLVKFQINPNTAIHAAIQDYMVKNVEKTPFRTLFI